MTKSVNVAVIENWNDTNLLTIQTLQYQDLDRVIQTPPTYTLFSFNYNPVGHVFTGEDDDLKSLI